MSHAVHTLLQLFPPLVFSPKIQAEVEWVVPGVEVQDWPRFPWRGAMLDPVRHFIPFDYLPRFVDLLALHKLNVLHLHLTDDQGWRIQIHKYPRLTEVGAWRKETLIGRFQPDESLAVYDDTPHGGFYTQDELKSLVSYAAQRGITILPEIEMPGHSQAAIAAYPWLGNSGNTLPVSTTWGIHENIYNPGDETIRFLQDVLEEVLAIFPGEYVHIGGDEAPKIQWRESTQAQQTITSLNLKDEDELQAYFIRRMETWLNAHGRRLIGWDEILEGGLAENATVMSWRGEEGGIAAARAGHDVIMAPQQVVYFDHYQSMDFHEPLALGGYSPLKKVFAYHPVPAALTPAEGKHVLGSQCQLWSEYIPNPHHLEYMAFPRLCAFSEALWTANPARDYDEFTTRLSGHLGRLDALGTNYRRLNLPE
jgi:hexosaminidase